MKKVIGLLAACLVLALPVQAQEMEQTERREATEIVGMTAQWDYIHRYTAENGAEIYFTSIEERPRIEWEDVNFDGAQDIVVMTNAGASNAMYEFFVREGDGYTYARYGTIDYGLANYRLDSEHGYVMTHANNGYAGALFENCIFRWEGNQMKLVRRAVSDLFKKVTYAADRYMETVYPDRLHVVVSDYQSGVEGGVTLMEKQLSVTEFDEEMFNTIDEVLWQGLKE